MNRKSTITEIFCRHRRIFLFVIIIMIIICLLGVAFLIFEGDRTENDWVSMVMAFLFPLALIIFITLPFFFVYYFSMIKKQKNISSAFLISELDKEMMEPDTLYFKNINTYLTKKHLIVVKNFVPYICEIEDLREFKIIDNYDYTSKYIVFTIGYGRIIISKCHSMGIFKVIKYMFDYKKNKEMVLLFNEVKKVNPSVEMSMLLQNYLEYIKF